MAGRVGPSMPGQPQPTPPSGGGGGLVIGLVVFALLFLISWPVALVILVLWGIAWLLLSGKR